MREKMSIEQRLFRLFLLSGLVCFFAFEAVSFLSLYDVEQRAMENSVEMGTSAAAFTEEIIDNQVKLRFGLLAKEKANSIKTEMAWLKEDTEILAGTMTQILTHPELYKPRRLPIGGETPIASGEPYLFFPTAAREGGHIPDILPHADIAANAADNMALWVGSYDRGHQMTCFFTSELGYLISADLMPEGTEFLEFYDEWYNPSFDTRKRPWYKEAKETGRTVFTDIVVGMEGYPAIYCVAPYYDSEGFAGIAGVSNDIDSLYRQIAVSELEGTDINFIVDQDGEILLSSEKTGPLAAGTTRDDLRNAGEQNLAIQVDRMVNGLSDVTLVTVGEDEYYLAYAPIPSMGWSFGTLIVEELVVQPANDANAQLLAQAEEFRESLRGIFGSNLLRTALLMLVLMIAFYFAGRRVADRFVTPILALTAGVRDIAGGNLDKKLSIHTGDEIEQLADSFNFMTDELKLYIENLERTTAEKEHIEAELSIAARIQAGILPNEFPAHEKFDLFAMMHPAKEVGGDFYDFYFLDDHRFLITIADVSDKGVPAALFMVRAKTVLGSSVITVDKEGGSLAEAVALANDELSKNNEEEQFVTVFMAIIDLDEGRITYVNAGHNLPALIHPVGGEDTTGEVEAFCLPKDNDPMLAVMSGLRFSEKTRDLVPGDILFLYTDGVTEAMNQDMEIFSNEKMLSTVKSLSEKNVREIVEGVFGAVKEHEAGAAQHDDATMLCIRWKGNMG